MKRPLFIIIGIALVLILIGVWVYILFFNTSSDDQGRYADLGLGDTTDPTYVPPSNDQNTESKPVVDVTGTERVRQLTTRPVVGYQEVQKTASSTPLVYYVESGTGHVFSIDLSTGEEKRVSGTTIPASRKAAITPNGQFIMLQSGSGAGAEFIVGTFSTTSEGISSGSIDERVSDFTFTTENTFLYAVKNSNSVVAKEYDPTSNAVTTLFTVPFREATIAWGSTATAVHHVYPKAAGALEGYVYRVQAGLLERLPIDGYGLSAVGHSEGVLYSELVEGTYRSSTYTADTNSATLGVSLLPEKCTIMRDTTNHIICGGSFGTTNGTLPDAWYKGTISFSDDLWQVDINQNSASFLISLADATGRELDLAGLQTALSGQHLYFTDHKTGHLWSMILSE